MILNIIPGEKEFLSFYLVQMGGWWNMYDTKVLTATNLNFKQIQRIMEKYDECYKIYIINKRLVPAKEWWREFACYLNPLTYIEDYSNKLNLCLNMIFINKHKN